MVRIRRKQHWTRITLVATLFAMHALPAAARVYCPIADVFFSTDLCCDEEDSANSLSFTAADDCCCRLIQTGKLTSATTTEERCSPLFILVSETVYTLPNTVGAIYNSLPNAHARAPDVGGTPLRWTLRLRI